MNNQDATVRELLLRLLGETISDGVNDLPDGVKDLPEYATPEQVSQLLQLSKGTLAQDRYRKVGIPYIKIGNRVRYRRKDVAAFLATNQCKWTL